MAKKVINITGTKGATYNLDDIKKDSRSNNETPLVIQVHTYKKGENPNPSNLKEGQLWMSKLEDSN